MNITLSQISSRASKIRLLESNGEPDLAKGNKARLYADVLRVVHERPDGWSHDDVQRAVEAALSAEQTPRWFTVIGWYEDNSQPWAEEALATSIEDAVDAARAILAKNNDGKLGEQDFLANICVAAVIEGRQEVLDP